jgi:hypothetical protein
MIVGILGPSGCGGTFLDWSIHFLRGDTKHYTVVCDPNKDRSQILGHHYSSVCIDPLTGTTAHNHLKTHPNNGSLQQVIDIFTQLPTSDLHTFYYVDSMRSDQTQTAHNNIIQQNKNCYFLTYLFEPFDIDKIFCFQFEKISSIVKKFDNMLVYPTQKLSELPIWEQRELLSLYYPKCIQGQTINEIIDFYPNNFLINFSKTLNSLDHMILEILEFLRITVDNTRWDTWLTIYQQWKANNNTNFFDELDTIIACILNNVDHDMTQYNMTFAREVVIASKLLYNHNKSLRSYNLEKIHPNTQHWHQILEENIYHNLTQD